MGHPLGVSIDFDLYFVIVLFVLMLLNSYDGLGTMSTKTENSISKTSSWEGLR